jgi:hypothetical protein
MSKKRHRLGKLERCAYLNTFASILRLVPPPAQVHDSGGSVNSLTSHQNKLEPVATTSGVLISFKFGQAWASTRKFSSILYVQYTGSKGHGNSKPSQTPPMSRAQPRRNGCTSASFGMMRLAGSRARHLSSKSTNDVRSLRSSSFICADEGGISLARRSRVGFDMCTLRTTSLKNCKSPWFRHQGSTRVH